MNYGFPAVQEERLSIGNWGTKKKHRKIIKQPKNFSNKKSIENIFHVMFFFFKFYDEFYTKFFTEFSLIFHREY